MTLKEWIFNIFRIRFCGKKSPIKRAQLLDIMNEVAIINNVPSMKFTDREMRVAYEGLAVCSSSKGLYLLKTEEERREQIALRMSLIYAHFRKIKIFREYKIDSDSVQKELF
ncbi:MAG TPA: hypothetical protein ENI23_04420 [bacterium]|nr:hypothetical protein [bacterium]